MAAATDQERQAFGAEVRRLRLLRGWTPPALARLVDKSDETIRRWEDGSWATDRRTVARLEQVLGAPGELLPLLGYDDEDTTLRIAALEREVSEIRKLVERLLRDA